MMRIWKIYQIGYREEDNLGLPYKYLLQGIISNNFYK